MRKALYFVFDTFRLDVLDERLWENERNVRLGHKAFAVLEYLVSQPGQLVTKHDLLSRAWPDTAVSEAVLTTAMREIRRALRDQARVPHYIETVHGRGYRFIAPVAETSVSAAPAQPTVSATIEPDALAHFHLSRVAPSGSLVGREAELTRLHEWYAAVEQGARRIVFVAGEAGIGKTVLAEAFVSEVAAAGKVYVGHGQCIQQYGAGEAYLPILEALGRLAREGALPVIDILRDYAPSWLLHLPSLEPDKEFDAPSSVTSERMLRELADALEILTAHDALILVLEDLHWSDTSTLELLAYIARRRDPARLMIVVTYRPVEVLLHEHPLRNLIAELRPRSQCPELVLDFLSSESVHSYVLKRCGRIPQLEQLAEVLYRRTGGHPLFLTTIVDELLRQRIMDNVDTAGFVAADPKAIAIPASVRQFIEHRFEHLSGEEQAILEAASVAGDPFSVGAVAAATSLAEEKIEACCAAWARGGQFLVACGATTWPDATLAARFGFRHAIFQEVVYAHISPERRARLHQRIGRRLERAYRKRVATIAAELAMHFEQGRDPRRAVSYLEQAARNALQRSAYSEAGKHITHGQVLLEALPEGRVRLRLELNLLLLLGQMLMTTKGWGVEEVASVYRRARVLCEQLDDVSRLFQAMWGLIAGSVVRAKLQETQVLASELLVLAKRQRNPIFQLASHMELGGTAFALGEASSARRHFQAADALYNPIQHPSHVARFGVDLGLFSRIWATHALWIWGYPDQARTKAGETVALASECSHLFTQAVTLAYATMLNQFVGDVDEVDRLAKATIAHSTEHGFPYYHAWAQVLEGWSGAVRGTCEDGITSIRRGIEVLQTMAKMRLPYYRALLADACKCSGRIDEALQAIADAFNDSRKAEERWWDAELHRLQGELLRLEAVNRVAEAEICFRTAIEVARGHQAKSLELRAAVSLGRLWCEQGKQRQARQLLVEVHDWFTEGFETPDQREARSLLEELDS